MHNKKDRSQNPHKQQEIHKTTNQQQQNHGFREDSSLSQRGLDLNAFDWRHISP